MLFETNSSVISEGSNQHPDWAILERDYLEQLINEHKAAEFIGFAVKTLRNWRVTGDGPMFVRSSGRAIRYRRKDLIVWAESNLVSNTSEAGQ